MTAPRHVTGARPLLLIADHASNAVPPGVDLGVEARVLDLHIAIDIGSAALADQLALSLDADVIIASVSRLVIDCNREPEAADVVPVASDGHLIPGNMALGALERSLRIDSFHTPYHRTIEAAIAAARPRLIVSLHSFTPNLATKPDQARPWPIGILHNHDDRAAVRAIDWLAGQGLMVGDNQPYSGRDLNYTMNRHAEANEIPYIGFEVRNDGLRSPAGIAEWAAVLKRCVEAVAAAF
jgi:predicted N-formylglutamate amidohydrolase